MSKGREYWGSSKWPNYQQIVAESDKDMQVLYQTEDDIDIIDIERDAINEMDAVASTEFFNLAAPVSNSFTDPNYASYKHVETGKRVRLPRDHPAVLSGMYVGITKGYKHTEEHKQKIGRAGHLNPFYGRTHTDETRQAVSDANTGRVHSAEARAKMSESRKGMPKSRQHRERIGRKGLRALKNRDTGECIRIPIAEANLYDSTIWGHPSAIAYHESTEEYKCPHCGKSTKSKGNANRWHFDNCKHKG